MMQFVDHPLNSRVSQNESELFAILSIAAVCHLKYDFPSSRVSVVTLAWHNAAKYWSHLLAYKSIRIPERKRERPPLTSTQWPGNPWIRSRGRPLVAKHDECATLPPHNPLSCEFVLQTSVCSQCSQLPPGPAGRQRPWNAHYGMPSRHRLHTQPGRSLERQQCRDFCLKRSTLSILFVELALKLWKFLIFK